MIASIATQEGATSVINVLSKTCNFDTPIVWNTVSGGANSTIDTSPLYPYSGKNSVVISFTDTGTHVFNIGSTAMDCTILRDGNYKLSWALLSEVPSAVINFKVNVYRTPFGLSTVLFQTFECIVSDTSFGYVNEQWNRFFQDLYGLDEDDVLSFEFEVSSDTWGSGERLFFDAFMMEQNDRSQIYPSIYTPVEDFTLEKTETLNFASIANGANSTLQVTALGALVGDFVQVVAPTAVYLAGLTATAQVTESDKIDVTLINTSGGAVDPASGDYKLYLIRR